MSFNSSGAATDSVTNNTKHFILSFIVEFKSKVWWWFQFLIIVQPIPPNMQLIDTPQAMKPETVIFRGSFLAIDNIAFSAHSEFKDKLILLRT